MSLILLGILNSQVTAAGGAAYDLLETQVLSSSAASVTFTGLGSYSDYKHLQIRLVAKDTVGGLDNAKEFYMTLNGDTGSNYARHRIYGNGGSVYSSASTSQTNIVIAIQPGASSDSNHFMASVLDILDFSNSSKNTTIRNLNGYASGSSHIGLYSGLWNSTAAVTSMTFAGESGFPAGSRFSLYGVK